MLKQTVSLSLVRLIMFGSALGLSACQSTTGCSTESTTCFAGANTGLVNKLFKSEEAIPQLNLQFNYMKLVMNGRTLWLAQGATTRFPVEDTKVFYSADRSVFKWSNGRLTSITTPLLDWHEYIKQPIKWSTAKPFILSRDVDTDAHITVVNEQRKLKDISVPKHHNYEGDDIDLVWVHEYTVAPSSVSHSYDSFDSWYAFDSQNMIEPIYGQQCISKQYCLSWQVWKIQ